MEYIYDNFVFPSHQPAAHAREEEVGASLRRVLRNLRDLILHTDLLFRCLLRTSSASLANFGNQQKIVKCWRALISEIM